MPLDSAVLYPIPFAFEPSGLLVATVGGQLAVGPDHPPPGQPVVGSEDVANCPGRSRVAGSACHLSVADDLSPTQVSNDDLDRLDERRFQLRLLRPY